MRIKLARARSKKHLLHLLTENPNYNYHIKENSDSKNELQKYQKELEKELSSILPSRKKWVSLGESSRRKPNKPNEFLTSNDKNFYSLLKTIKLHKKNNSKEIWFLNLQEFIAKIKNIVLEKKYSISPPTIFPELKGNLNRRGNNECRPICLFNFTDRIILSLTNKFLTQLFDDKFKDSSYAFRVKKRENQIISHHDCVKDILKYRNDHKNEQLYVVECDMKKFFDTIDHKIVKDKFNELISLSRAQFPKLDLDFAILIFNKYLDSYSFNINAPKTTDIIFWRSYGIQNGYFGWVDDEISDYYENISNERIGIPQGGALSGLIANIILNETDTKMENYNVFYSRFCDDMIIISTSLDECLKSQNKYVETLRNLKLFPHAFKNDIELIDFDTDDNIYYKPFWKGKSKGPYQWGKIEDLNFPWIGFVGYEINYKGEIRVRKRSFKKEIKKQKAIVQEIKDAVSIGRRKPKGTITESAINRLIGMSVGRIGMDNFEEVSTDLCWKNGFKLLSINEHSLNQIRDFDRNRSKNYYNLIKELKPIEDPEIETNQREPIKYNKPFSYYYQILERSKNESLESQHPADES
jgi:retron-type reverse transcriptase